MAAPTAGRCLRAPFCSSLFHLRPSPPRPRRYHTAASPTPPAFGPTESAILAAALSHVPELGFSQTALERGAQDAGYLPASPAIFPHGPFELVRFHLVTRRLALGEEVQFAEREGEEKWGLTRKVRALLLARLRANEAVIHRWQEVSVQSDLS